MEVPRVRDLLDFTGKTVIITGAGTGIGASIGRRFAEARADIVINYRSSEFGAQTLAEKVEALGGRALAVKADVSTAAGAALLVKEALSGFGQVDVLVNNAGSYPVTPLLGMSESDWGQALRTNLSSVHLCTQAVACEWVARTRGGAVVNIGSIEADNPAPGHAHYDAAKAGVVTYTRAAANELGPYGIRVNCVSPGLISREGLESDWPEGVNAYRAAVPLKRLGDGNDVADACLFLASPAARWITGANLVVDGGVMTHRIY